jgi:hypothetical protein
MPISRRGFIRQVLAVGPVAMVFYFDKDFAWAQGGPECTLPDPGTPKRFVPRETNVVQRMSAAELAKPENAPLLKTYHNAFGMVRSLPQDDVIGWTKLIAQHCINCARSYPTNIHFDQQFFPWHRGLLYFLERNLRKLSKNDDLRLVYWDWENPASRVLPAIYRPTGQPLYWANRGDLSGPNWPLVDDDVNVQGLLAVPDFATFGGSTVQGKPTPAGFSGPHANVHNNFDPGDMADLQYSPRDPVFYAHHGNIDRLWSSWAAVPGHKNPDFGDAKVYFYDENRVWSYVLLNDLRDETKLGYKYSTLMRPKVSTAQMRAAALSKSGNRFSLATEAIARAEAPGPDFLVIQNAKLDKFPADAVRFGVFVGAPPAGIQAAQAQGFLGKISRVRSSGHDHHASPLSAAFEVSGKIAPLAKSRQGALDLHVAPLDATGKTTAAALPIEADSVKIIN